MRVALNCVPLQDGWIGAAECERLPSGLVPIHQIVNPGKGTPGSTTVHVKLTSLPGHTGLEDAKLLPELVAAVTMY